MVLSSPNSSKNSEGGAWAPTQCTPRDSETAPLNAGAGALATTSIVEADKATATTLAGPGSAKNGTPVTLTANVAPAANGGTVQFKDGDVALGNPIALAGGNAAITTTFTTDGDHSITAVYSGAPGRGVHLGCQDRQGDHGRPAGRGDDHHGGGSRQRQGRAGREPHGAGHP